MRDASHPNPPMEEMCLCAHTFGEHIGFYACTNCDACEKAGGYQPNGWPLTTPVAPQSLRGVQAQSKQVGIPPNEDLYLILYDKDEARRECYARGNTAAIDKIKQLLSEGAIVQTIWKSVPLQIDVQTVVKVG
jgi:hypothetical protein